MRRSGAPTERLCWAWTLSFGQRPHIFRDGLAPTVVIAGAPIWEKARARLRLRRISMSDQRGFVSADEFHPDPYTQSRTAERTLNSAILHADITRSYEEYLEIFDEFYADDIEGSSEAIKEPIRGKASVRSLLLTFIVLLHAMAEVGGVSISIRERAIPGDVADETNLLMPFARQWGRPQGRARATASLFHQGHDGHLHASGDFCETEGTVEGSADDRSQTHAEGRRCAAPALTLHTVTWRRAPTPMQVVDPAGFDPTETSSLQTRNSPRTDSPLAAQRLHVSRHRSHPSRACRPRRSGQYDPLLH
jgi:hypothetical protein